MSVSSFTLEPMASRQPCQFDALCLALFHSVTRVRGRCRGMHQERVHTILCSCSPEWRESTEFICYATFCCYNELHFHVVNVTVVFVLLLCLFVLCLQFALISMRMCVQMAHALSSFRSFRFSTFFLPSNKFPAAITLPASFHFRHSHHFILSVSIRWLHATTERFARNQAHLPVVAMILSTKFITCSNIHIKRDIKWSANE